MSEGLLEDSGLLYCFALLSAILECIFAFNRHVGEDIGDPQSQ